MKIRKLEPIFVYQLELTEDEAYDIMGVLSAAGQHNLTNDGTMALFNKLANRKLADDA